MHSTQEEALKNLKDLLWNRVTLHSVAAVSKVLIRILKERERKEKLFCIEKDKKYLFWRLWVSQSTDNELEVPSPIPVMGTILSSPSYPDRLWASPTLLSSGYKGAYTQG
jgi:hypothetical protein